MLKLRGVLPVRFRWDREDVVVELAIFLELMSYLVLPHPNKRMTMTGRSWPGGVSSSSRSRFVPGKDS